MIFASRGGWYMLSAVEKDPGAIFRLMFAATPRGAAGAPPRVTAVITSTRPETPR